MGRLDTPRLLALTTTNQRRGAEIQAERFADGLARLGWAVEMRSLTSSSPPVTGARSISDRGPAALGGMSVPIVRAVRRTISDLAPDIVLAWGSATLRYVAVATATRRRSPARGYVAIGSPSDWVRSGAQRARYRALTSRYGFVIAVSEHTRDELVGFIGVPAPRVHVIRSGIPAEYVEIPSSPRATEFRILVAGSLSEEKDPMAALEAAATVAATFRVAIRFVGEGPLRERLSGEAGRLGIRRSVELTGAEADVRPHLAWADVLLLTSRTEGLPGIVIEAASAGLPVVAYDVGAVDEIVEDGASGLLVPSRKPAGAAAALTLLAGDDDLRARYGARARRIAEDRFLIDDAAALLDRVLRAQLS